ncbi:hypothetical protein LJR289_002342 [Pseudoduganella sp. LjRoot289]|uniref:hypothetical protein n=1 Tax=Pseudoduganella sp. LjRoot289 TaxID=3342314 RepID=UPI003ECF6B27
MGCCGSKRQQVVQKIQAARGGPAGEQSGVQGRWAARMAAGVPFATPATASPAQMQRAAPTGVPFIYDGLPELVVTGSATGRRYRFAARGARLMVDALDAPSMRKTPKLRCLA